MKEETKQMINWINNEFIPFENKTDDIYNVFMSDNKDRIVISKVGAYDMFIGQSSLKKLIDKCSELNYALVIRCTVNKTIEINIESLY